MPRKLRDFTVTLNRAERERGYFVTHVELGGGRPQKRFQASTTEQVVAEAAAFARAHGKPCQAHVHLVQGRKPAGFDVAVRSLYYNMDLPVAC